MTKNLALVPNATRTPVETLVEDYLAHVRARGLSIKTVAHYNSVLHRVLLPFCAERGLTTPRQLDQRALDRLSTSLLDGGGARGELSRHSVHSYLRAISHFLAWARREGEVGEAKPQLPKLDRKILDVLEREEIKRLEDAAQTERDKLIVRLLADTGMRAGELCGIRPDDLIEQGRDRFVKVRGKGRKERLVPITGLYRRLRTYAQRGRPDAAGDHLFISLRRRPRTGDYEPLNVSGVEQLLRGLAVRAGISKRVYPHLLRHSFITHAVRKGMNPVTLARIVGHEDLGMIQGVYSHLNQSDTAAAMMALLREES